MKAMKAMTNELCMCYVSYSKLCELWFDYQSYVNNESYVSYESMWAMKSMWATWAGYI